MRNNNSTGVASTKRKGMKLSQKKGFIGRLFVYPWFIGVLIFVLVPIIMSVQYTFSDMEVLVDGGYSLTFAGFKNYSKAFKLDAFFLDYFYQGLSATAAKLPLVILFSVFSATMLNQKFRGRGFVRSMFFLPVIITSGALVYALNTNISSDLFDTVSQSSSVMLNNMDIQLLLLKVTNNTEAINFIVSIMDQVFIILWASGVQILIFLSGLQSISVSIYESAKVDGASGWETFWKITIPLIMPLMVVNVIYTIIDSFSDYNSELLRYINSTIFGKADTTYGTTLAWIYSIAMFLMILVIVFALRKTVERYSE